MTVLRLATTDGSEAKIVEIVPTNVTTEAGIEPKLPTTVTAKYDNGIQRQESVVWDSIDPSKYAQAGTFTVEGTVQGTTVKAVANITVIEITAVQPVNVKTDVGAAPKLPSTVTVVYNNGSEGTKAVVWDAIDPSLYAKDGTFKVEGTVEGTNIKAVANVTVGKAPGLEEGLVLWYKFNDANGTTVTDSSGSGYNGKLYGTPNWVEGMEGSALSFNGTDNYIEVGDGTALQPSKITVAYWIKRTASMNNAERLVFWAKPDTGWNQNGWFITYNSGKSSIMVVDGFNGFCVDEQPNNFLPLNEWTHVVVTFDSETKEAAIYKNGVPQTVLRGEAANLGGDPSSITATDPSDIKYMGFNGPTWAGAWLNATLDDFRIYNKALTEEEVKALYEEEEEPQIEPTIESIKPV